jgi:hypothetical protein
MGHLNILNQNRFAVKNQNQLKKSINLPMISNRFIVDRQRANSYSADCPSTKVKLLMSFSSQHVCLAS